VTEVLDLLDGGRALPGQIGGKAAGLSRLLSLGFDVPAGFVVTVDAYRDWIRRQGFAGKIEHALARAGDLHRAREVAQEIAWLFASRELQSEAIDAAYARLTAPVAVRSSAIGEDGAEASYAGQQETFLSVSGAGEVRRRIVDCWASLFSAEAIMYRRHVGAALDELAMAVVVQTMVAAEAAGVLFTLDPLTGDPSQITIESTFGLGAPLVSGELTPDRFCVDAVTLEIRTREVRVKPFCDRVDAASGTVQRVPLDAEKAGASSLGNDEVLALARMGVRLRRALDQATDVEWAIGPRGGEPRHLFVLQARPATGTAVASAGRRAATGTPPPALTRIVSGLRTNGLTTTGERT
jgi:phosphoenolpyruvate synthase/pyruvate phosphate dikinase